jgi:hypothetical protein
MNKHTMLWRRLDTPGHDAAVLVRTPAGWRLEGTAVFVQDRTACQLAYRVTCDRRWRTVDASVAGWLGIRRIGLEAAVMPEGGWLFGGASVPAVDGCIDIDFDFTPATNLLPIRRLSLEVGESARVRAAWLTIPECTLAPLAQTYTRVAPNRYRYETDDGFKADFETTAQGFVVRYPGLWESEARG